jgi:hypothetical protein
MTTYQQNVDSISKEIYRDKFAYPQVLIDFVQEEVEALFAKQPSRDAAGGLACQIKLLLEIYNPARTREIDFLNRLKEALNAWSQDIERTNMALGLPKES